MNNIRIWHHQIKPWDILFILFIITMHCTSPVDTDENEIRPEIISTPLKCGIVGESYLYDVNASGNPTPTYTLAASPSGMTIDSITGSISWTPTAGSDFKVTVTVEAVNTLGSGSQTWDIRIGGLQIEGLETATFPMVHMDQSKIDALLSHRQNGKYPYIHSILVIKDDALVLEEYFRGRPYHWPYSMGPEIQFERWILHHQASVTKSFISILTGIALENDIITSLDETPFDFFPEYESYLNWDDLKSQMTLEHLITMTAGFEWGEDGESFFSVIYPSNDWIKSSLDLPVVHTPGDIWDYFSPGPDILGAVISKASGLHLAQFASQYLFDPMGIPNVVWYTTPTGRAFGGGCHRMRPIDMAKIGALMLNNGVWQGQQIIPRRWIIESTAEYNPGYGYLWWKFLIQCGDSWIESTVAAGAGGQRIYIIPDLEMVVVFTAGYYDPDNEVLGGQHTHEIVEDYLVPAILSEYPLPPPPSG